MEPDKHLLSPDEDVGSVFFESGFMVPTVPFERVNGKLILKIYDQEGSLIDLPVKDNRTNEMFGVWLRRFDRYT